MDEPVFTPEFTREYEIICPVGSGGMARVYKARQRSLERIVAVKVLSPLAFTEEDSRARFDLERKLSSQIKHDNIVALLSFGDLAGTPYLVFEFIDGMSLRELLNRRNRLPVQQALRIARDIAAGLAAAHAVKIVHRDLKPDNVLMDIKGVAKISDFGLARSIRPNKQSQLTKEGIILGTPGYLAPEVIRGEPATPGSDMFAMGVLLYEMITGSLPHAGSSDRELLMRYVREEIRPLSASGVEVPEALEQLTALLLKRDPAARPGSATRVGQALRQIQEDPSRPLPTELGAPQQRTSAPAKTVAATVTIQAPPRRLKTIKVTRRTAVRALAGLAAAVLLLALSIG
ncbi:MAG: serine/threonine protein kinase, partial [Candidatus Riflebacteria bacterium]|nr:serine/threonine protein kinase [Candidatus Riflebacteria bacterium]